MRVYNDIHTHSHSRTRLCQQPRKKILSPKRCKPGKYAGWKHRQLVAAEIKYSVGRRKETVSHTLAAIAAPSRVRQYEGTRDKCVWVLSP